MILTKSSKSKEVKWCINKGQFKHDIKSIKIWNKLLNFMAIVSILVHDITYLNQVVDYFNKFHRIFDYNSWKYGVR